MRIPQPRLRHRFQQDRVGLTRSVHRLVGEGEDLDFELEPTRAPPPSTSSPPSTPPGSCRSAPAAG